MILVLLTIVAGGAIGGDAAQAAQATPVSSPAVSPVADEAVVIDGLVVQPGALSVADLQRFPVETVDVTYETRDGAEQHSFTGTRLSGVLDAVGFVVGPDERNPLLTRYVVVTAKDGYLVALSGGEIDPDFGDAPMLLAWEQDGQPLTGEDGPVRLVAPGDTRGGRYVYGVVRIEVLGIAGVLGTP